MKGEGFLVVELTALDFSLLNKGSTTTDIAPIDIAGNIFSLLKKKKKGGEMKKLKWLLWISAKCISMKNTKCIFD